MLEAFKTCYQYVSTYSLSRWHESVQYPNKDLSASALHDAQSPVQHKVSCSELICKFVCFHSRAPVTRMSSWTFSVSSLTCCPWVRSKVLEQWLWARVERGSSSKLGNSYLHLNLTRGLQGEKIINCIYRSAVLTPVFGKLSLSNVLKKRKRDSEKVSIFLSSLEYAHGLQSVFHNPWQSTTGNVHRCHWREDCETRKGTWLFRAQGPFSTEGSASLQEARLPCSAGNGCRFMCSKLHEKISALAKELKKPIKFLFLSAPPQKNHLLNNSQPN